MRARLIIYEGLESSRKTRSVDVIVKVQGKKRKRDAAGNSTELSGVGPLAGERGKRDLLRMMY